MKVIFITGGCANTGLAIARRFAKAGYAVAVSSRDKNSAADTAAALSSEYGITARGYALSQADTDDIKRVFSEIKRDFDRLDCFVANAAHLGVDFGVLNTSPDKFDEVMNVISRGSFFCCQAAAEIMKQQDEGGTIVTVGSIHSTGCVRGRLPYAMSKAAMSEMVRCLAYELGEYGIRANNIIAGAIHSKRWDSISEEEKAKRRSRYPIGHEAAEEDIANAVYYLGTDMSASTTGTDLVVDSGLSTCILPYSKAPKQDK